MGFWDFDDKITVEKTVKEIAVSSYSYKSELINFNFVPYIRRFNDEELLSDIIRRLANKGMDFELHIDFITDIYESICLNKDKVEEKTIFGRLFDLYIENPEIFVANNNFEKIDSSFQDKQLVLEFFRFIIRNENILKDTNLDNLSQIMGYVSSARQYYVDDRALLASAINLVNRFDPILLKRGDATDVKRIIDFQLEEDRKAAGIYNFDEGTIAELAAKIEELGRKGNDLQSLLSIAKQVSEELKKATMSGKSEINQEKIKVLAELNNKVNGFAQNFNDSYTNFFAQQQQSLLSERDSLVGELDRIAEKAKTDIKNLATGTNQRVTIELGRIRDVGKEVKKDIESMAENNETIRKVIAESKDNDTIAQALAYATQLSQQTGFVLPAQAQPDASGKIEMPQATGAIAVPNIIIPGEDHEHGRVVDTKINYLYDKRIPFSERFAELQARKASNIREKGAIYHENFDVLAKTIMVGQKPPYLVGDSGTGKTFAAKQFAELAEQRIVSDSYIKYEQELLGFNNAGTGSYVPSNFYRCYKYGDIYLLDELDNSRPSVIIMLNGFMGDSNKSHTFPDGIALQKNPNFRIITSGNTKGGGKTSAYSAREKLDEATLQRLFSIKFTHDNKLVKNILEQYPEWYDFSINFRDAISEWSINVGNNDEKNSVGTFTTRDAHAIREYKESDVFTDEEILKYEFVSTKDEDTLNFICETMGRNKSSFQTQGGRKLFDLFVEKCNEAGEKKLCKRM